MAHSGHIDVISFAKCGKFPCRRREPFRKSPIPVVHISSTFLNMQLKNLEVSGPETFHGLEGRFPLWNSG